MAHTYLLFDFGTDEEKAQLARHKLEGWKQAFRLDKKLQYKLERAEDEADAKPDAKPDEAHKAAETPKAEKPKAKTKAKHKSKEAEAPEEVPLANGKVNLLVRLYFSGHEKLTEQRWLDRIPSEEPFKEASPRVVRQGEDQFDEVVKQFDSLG
jgi:outer membrane biosynthesis protein TonB